MVEGGTLLVLLLRAHCQRLALQGSSSNGRGRNITCPPFVCALPAFGVSGPDSLSEAVGTCSLQLQQNAAQRVRAQVDA